MNNYPSEEQLKKIESWDWRDAKGLVEFIQVIWQYGELAFHIRKGRDGLFRKLVYKIEMHTIGWSGNEDIIESLEKNFFYTLFLQKSERGGHYYFEINPEFWK